MRNTEDLIIYENARKGKNVIIHKEKCTEKQVSDYREFLTKVGYRQYGDATEKHEAWIPDYA